MFAVWIVAERPCEFMCHEDENPGTRSNRILAFGIDFDDVPQIHGCFLEAIHFQENLSEIGRASCRERV